ncbi:hypothetical protein [Desulfonatronovibrio magnus]|uniref:hypothetical protein n=1 Tax=Desulfonatronovibrio magnus TaxID=698827 RepID=UPI0005EB6C17|nr:hypothetical protein [Desulfonatronovibrio magnus]
MNEIKIMEDCQVSTNNPELLCRSLGLPAGVPLFTALDQLFGSLLPVTPENQDKINVFLQLLMANSPRNLLEAQLIIQLLMCHRLCAKMLKKTSREMFPEIAEKYLNMAMKLSRNFNKGLECLSKIQRGGKQHIVVENVYVEKDAQAIIGNVNRG